MHVGRFVSLLVASIGVLASTTAPAFSQTGSISGTVTAGGTAAPSVSVAAYNSSGGYASSTYTNGLGQYTLASLPAGTYYLRTEYVPGGYWNQVYNGVNCAPTCPVITTGTPVVVTAGATTPGITFALARSGTLSGTVLASGTAASAGVSVYNAVGVMVSTTYTSINGLYSVSNLPTGTYFARAESVPTGYWQQTYSGSNCVFSCPSVTTGTPISVTEGTTTSGIDFALVRSGTVAGTMTASGVPVASGFVRVYNGVGTSVGAGSTDAGGRYSIAGLPTGTYYVRAEYAPTGYWQQTYSGLNCAPTCPPIATGTPVAVNEGATTSGIDFALVRVSTISGTVTAGGAPAVSLTVRVYTASGSVAGIGVTDQTGSFTVTNLAASSYYVRVESAPSGYWPQAYAGLSCRPTCPAVTAGTPVVVGTGTTVSGIDFVLARTGTIAGTVAAGGTPAAAVGLALYNANGSQFGGNIVTDGAGRYSVTNLPTGTYFMRATTVPTGYWQQTYSGQNCSLTCPSVTTGTPVAVTEGTTTSGIDFALVRYGAIGGTATAGGTPVANVRLALYNALGGELSAYATTNALGQYSIPNLSSGTYYVRTSSVPSGFWSQIYGGVNCVFACPSITTGTPVTVTEGATTSGIDFPLTRFGSIEGTVTSGGVPGARVGVNVFNATGNQINSVMASADDSGHYALTGLPAGTYFVATSYSVPEGHWRQIYRGVNCVGTCPSVTTGTPVAVTEGTTTTGIDFALVRAGAISGSVTAGGLPAARSYVAAFDVAGDVVGSPAYVDDSGRYTIWGLPGGTYYLRSTSAPAGYRNQVYQGLNCGTSACPVVSSGTPVSVTLGTTTSAVDFALADEASAVTSYYLAEGATSAFFDMRLAFLNPNSAPASATLTFARSRDTSVTHALTVPGRSRVTLDPKTVPGLAQAEFSTRVDANQPLVVDRTMSWDASGYGAHAETALTAPSSKWYLAEGATHSGFNLFYLLQNPNQVETLVHVRYLRPSGMPLEKTYTLPPSSRTNIWVNLEEFPDLGQALASAEVSAVIESPAAQPIIVERAMYLDRPGQMFGAGHESAGVTAPATQWFLAEGATGSFFDLFILVANPADVDASIEATYLLPDGTTVVKSYLVPASSRFNIWVDLEDERLASTSVSTTIRSTDGVPVIVERAMWWPGTGWYEAHNSPGTTSAGTKWALAEGEVGGSRGVDTYILIANTSPVPGSVKVTLMFEGGAPTSRVFDVNANSRFNVDVAHEFPQARDKRFGAVVESTGTPFLQLVVERAMYWNAKGQSWAAGTNALGTRLQ